MFKLRIKKIVTIAVCGALMFVGQVALRIIPNVEVVTLFVIAFTVVFGLSVSLPAVLIFCTLEWVTYGFGYWVPAYYVYWSLLAVLSQLLRRAPDGRARTLFAASLAVICTVAFGALTTLVDVLFSMRNAADFLRFYPVMYLRGIYFYITHIVSNGIVVGLLFAPLTALLRGIERRNET